MMPNNTNTNNTNGEEPFANELPSPDFVGSLAFDDLEDEFHQTPSMSWFDIEGLVDTIDSAVDTKLESLNKRQSQSGSDTSSMFESFLMDGGEVNNINNNTPQVTAHSRVINEMEYQPPPRGYHHQQQMHMQMHMQQQMHMQRGGLGGGGYFHHQQHQHQQQLHRQSSYEAQYHTNNLNQPHRTSSRIKAGFDALADTFRQGGRKSKKESGKKKNTSKKGANANKKGGDFMNAIKNVFRPPNKISPLSYEDLLSVSSSSKNSSGERSPGTLKRTTSLQKKKTKKVSLSRASSLKNDDLMLRSLSDIPKSSLQKRPPNYDFTVEGAIKSLLSGQGGSRRSAAAGSKTTGQLHGLDERSFYNANQEEEVFGSPGEKGSPTDPFGDPFGYAAKNLTTSQRWVFDAQSEKKQTSYNLQEVTKQLFSPPAGGSARQMRGEQDHPSANVARCLSSKW
eukprot:CAMPEP_0197471488 /NCGR_PEP_ID=MMETSP1309-20131121/2435_1 /TAXON_ID=464262 /ORGANISM="Genus nov. species nov., Strain RCC998" /LENGTH=450 /DNA_ID=CAMNT_0043009255 /DNA_START=427 /DNA_END=1779 /DNA_ORIENTATION=-